MKMSIFCIHSSRLLLSIILLFIKQRKQVIAVKYLFCKFLKRKCSQMKILKLLFFAKFHCASDDIFFKFLWSKLNFLQEKQTSIWSLAQFATKYGYDGKGYLQHSIYKIDLSQTNSNPKSFYTDSSGGSTWEWYRKWYCHRWCGNYCRYSRN